MASPSQKETFLSLSLSLFQKAKKSAFLLLLFSRVKKGKKESAGTTTLSRFSYFYIYSRRASFIYIIRKDYYILVTTTTRRLDFVFFWSSGWLQKLSFERFTHDRPFLQHNFGFLKERALFFARRRPPKEPLRFPPPQVKFPRGLTKLKLFQNTQYGGVAYEF